MDKLKILANNIGMSNVYCTPLSWILRVLLVQNFEVVVNSREDNDGLLQR